MHDLFGETATLAQLGGALANLRVERHERRVVLVRWLHLVDRHHDRREVVVHGGVLQGRRALLTLQEKLHAAQPTLDLPDARDDAHRVEDVRGRLVGVVTLRDGKHETVALEGGLDGAQGSRTARGDGRRQAGEDDRPPKRENGKRLAFSHVDTWMRKSGLEPAASASPAGMKPGRS